MRQTNLGAQIPYNHANPAIFFSFFFFELHHVACENFPEQKWNCDPCIKEHEVLTLDYQGSPQTQQIFKEK